MQYNPVTIITDFECGLINACAEVFDESKSAGCAFHFGQANWRKVQQCGLVQSYKRKDEIYEIYQKCLNLSFYPESDVLAGFNTIKAMHVREDTEGAIKTFVRYFEENYVCGKNGRDPTYPISFWSTHDRILGDIPRTTNALEAWHRSLNHISVSAHPNLARFLEILKQEETLISFRLKRLLEGMEIETTSSNFRRVFQLKKVVANKHIFDDEAFFKALSNVQQWKTN